MLALAASKAREAGLPVRFARAVAEGLPFPTGSFDLLVSVTTLEFVTSPQAVVAEMMRVLRAGGRLVVGVLNAWSLWALAYRWRRRSIYDLAHFFSPPALLALLRPYGPVVWQSRLFVPPWAGDRAGRGAKAWESFGSRRLRPFGAFLVARVEKRR